MNDPFEKLIGQAALKQRLLFELEAFKKRGVYRNKLFLGGAGEGKTVFAKACARGLTLARKQLNPETAGILTIQGKSLSDLDSFVTTIVRNHLFDKHGPIILIDEAQGMKQSIAECLLSLVEPDADFQSHYYYDGFDYRFDVRNFNIFLTTSESDQIFLPLKSRFHEETLDELTIEELAKVIQLYAQKKINDDAAIELANFCNKNPRKAFQLAMEVNNYCLVKDLKVFQLEHVVPLVQLIRIYPGGISKLELKVLYLLAQNHKGLTLKDLASYMNQTKSSQMAIERNLTRQNLISIDVRRFLTHRGQLYLEMLKDWEGNN